MTFNAAWEALARALLTSPLALGSWLALVAVFAAGSALVLRRLLPQAATDNPVRRVAKNAAFPMATSLVNKGLDLAFAMVFLRVLGPAEAGKYAWIVVVIGYFDILQGFGMNTWLTREVARQPARLGEWLGQVLGARTAIWAGLLALALLMSGPLAAPLAITPDVALTLLLLVLAMAPSGLAAALSALFYARERMEYPAAVALVTNVLKVALGVPALALGLGIVGLGAVALLVNLITLAILLLLFRDLIGWPRLAFARVASAALARESYPFMLNDLLASLFFRIDGLLLRPLAGNAALGWYSAAYRVPDGLSIIPMNFTLALFPLLARQGSADRAALARTYRRALKILLCFALPASVGITLLAEPLVTLIAGPAYVPQSVWALQVLVWFLPFSYVNGVTQYVLIAADRQRFLTVAFLIATVFNVAANLLLIPRYGYLGAAAITVLSEAVLLGPFWWAVSRHLPPVGLLGVAWRPALAAVGMGALVAAVAPWSWLLAIPVGAAGYLALLALLGTFDADDRALLRRLLERKPPRAASRPRDEENRDRQ
jgi:O-antigen/teichoic acid export membrane protein